jgi:hypothetical protein
MNEEPRASAFDALARGLASGTLSRGKALRLMGAALVGGALASVSGVAWAAPCPSGQTHCGRLCCEEGQCCKGGRSSQCCSADFPICCSGSGAAQCCPTDFPKCCSARGETICTGPNDICCITPDGLTATDTVTTCEELLGGKVIS